MSFPYVLLHRNELSQLHYHVVSDADSPLQLLGPGTECEEPRVVLY